MIQIKWAKNYGFMFLSFKFDFNDLLTNYCETQKHSKTVSAGIKSIYRFPQHLGIKIHPEDRYPRQDPCQRSSTRRVAGPGRKSHRAGPGYAWAAGWQGRCRRPGTVTTGHSWRAQGWADWAGGEAWPVAPSAPMPIAAVDWCSRAWASGRPGPSAPSWILRAGPGAIQLPIASADSGSGRYGRCGADQCPAASHRERRALFESPSALGLARGQQARRLLARPLYLSESARWIAGTWCSSSSLPTTFFQLDKSLQRITHNLVLVRFVMYDEPARLTAPAGRLPVFLARLPVPRASTTKPGQPA